MFIDYRTHRRPRLGRRGADGDGSAGRSALAALEVTQRNAHGVAYLATDEALLPCPLHDLALTGTRSEHFRGLLLPSKAHGWEANFIALPHFVTKLIAPFDVIVQEVRGQFDLKG